MTKTNNFSYSGCFIDKRLDKRCTQIANNIYNCGNTVIEQFNSTRKGVVGSCRFFNNSRVSLESIIESVTCKIKEQVKGKEVLCIEDTTEFNYTSKQGRIKSGSLGPVTKTGQIGFFMHPNLIIDSRNYMPIGLSHIHIWKRPQNTLNKKERRYFDQPLEEKESYRWIESVNYSKNILCQAKHTIVIADREADIYALYTRLKDDKTDLIIRMRNDRRTQEGITIREKLQMQSVKSVLKMDVKADTKDNRSAHIALLQIKYCTVNITRPDDTTNKGTIKHFAVNIVQIKECSRTVKKGERPIEWILLTTLSVNNTKAARKILSYYSKRWVIEELFATLKTRGLSLENSQLSHGQSLMKLAVIAMDVAVKVIQLTKGRDDESLRAEEVFNKEEICLLKELQKHYEGETEKQKNPFKINTLAWAAWVIGRMGGWKGYKSESPPGNRTMKRGLEKLNSMQLIYNIMTQNVCRD